MGLKVTKSCSYFERKISIYQILLDNEVIIGKAEFRRLLDKRAIKVDGLPIIEPGEVLFLGAAPRIIQVGKKHVISVMNIPRTN